MYIRLFEKLGSSVKIMLNIQKFELVVSSVDQQHKLSKASNFIARQQSLELQ